MDSNLLEHSSYDNGERYVDVYSSTSDGANRQNFQPQTKPYYQNSQWQQSQQQSQQPQKSQPKSYYQQSQPQQHIEQPRLEYGNYYVTRDINQGKIVHNMPRDTFMTYMCMLYTFLVWTFFLPASIPSCVSASCINARDAGIDLSHNNDLCPNFLVVPAEIMPSNVHGCYITDVSGCPTNSCPSIIFAVGSMFFKHAFYALVIMSVLHFLYQTFTIEKKDNTRDTNSNLTYGV